MNLAGKTIVLGVSGGIAAYKAPELVRALRQANARVRVILTSAGREFVTPLTLQTMSGEPVATALFDLTQESQIGHIELADCADLVLIAPATADVIGKLAAGIADDLLTTVMLATRAKVVLAPAMNVHMFENPIVQQNLARLLARGMRVVEPDSGFLACGYEGLGRLPDASDLLEEVARALAPQDLAGEHLLITAGPTREFLDPVRFLSNRSSGKMGYAVARAAWRRGAQVMLVSGPTALPDPRGVTTVRVETAAEMAASVETNLDSTTIVIAAAAVADYRPAERAADKTPKLQAGRSLALEATRDIIGTLSRPSTDTIVVGFAAETSEVVERARAKLARKRLDLIVANDVTRPGAGFDGDTNQVTLIDPSGTTDLPLLGKDEVADAILDRIVALRSTRNAALSGHGRVNLPRRAKVSHITPARSRGRRKHR